MSLIRKWYGVEELSELQHADVIVAIDYGSLVGSRVLPAASVAGLRRAALLLELGVGSRIAWASTEHFGRTLGTINWAKCELLADTWVPPSSILCCVSADNSISEAEQLLRELPPDARIILVCDWRHAPRLKRIWTSLKKAGSIAFVTTDTAWNEYHPSFWCRSSLRWFLANVVHHALIAIFGVSALRHVRHPTG